MRWWFVQASLAFGAACLGFAAEDARADDFYKGKNVILIVSAGTGGGNATYARTLVRHMGSHLPGEPNFVVQHMPGGGGIRATNYLYSNAPKDGTVFGMVHSSVPLAPLYGMEAAKYDVKKFNWLGSMNMAAGICVAWHTAPIKNWDDVKNKQFIVGGTGAGSQMETLPAMLNTVFQTKNKIISGYQGGNDVYLAMERGEVHGRCGGLKTSIKSTRPDWFPQKKINVVVQIARERDPDFPDVPSVIEFVNNDRDRGILELIFASQELDRPMVAPPDLPAERVKLLRAAFVATMQDAKFREDAEKQHMEVDFYDGDHLAKILDATYKIPADVVQAAVEALKPKSADRTLKEGAKERGPEE